MESKETKLVVLIDAENVPPTKIKSMLNELTRYGDPIIKRIYGDWTTPQVGGWKSTLLEHAIIPVQQYKYTYRNEALASSLPCCKDPAGAQGMWERREQIPSRDCL